MIFLTFYDLCVRMNYEIRLATTAVLKSYKTFVIQKSYGLFFYPTTINSKIRDKCFS